MKSTEVYRALRPVLAPYCKEQGFRRTKSSMLSWYFAYGDQFVTFWCQCSQYGWDDFAGSQFVVEFQASPDPAIGTGMLRRRLGTLLSDIERARLLRLQNEVIAALPRPPRNHPFLQHSRDLAEFYNEQFEPVRKPYRPTDDVWLRYYKHEDVVRWGEFILRALPGALRAFEGAIRRR